MTGENALLVAGVFLVLVFALIMMRRHLSKIEGEATAMESDANDLRIAVDSALMRRLNRKTEDEPFRQTSVTRPAQRVRNTWPAPAPGGQSPSLRW
jgi:hypothetical protein